MRQKREKQRERHQSCQNSLHCPRVKCNKFWKKDTLVKLNKWQTGLFQPSKVSLNFSVFNMFNIKLELSTANNHFWYCCLFFMSDLMHNSTGYITKQLVHAFTCALSTYWSTWEIWRALKELQLPSAIASNNSYACFVLSKLPVCSITW